MINNRQNGRRRGRSGGAPRPNGGNSGTGNRIDNRARGNAHQLHEKYKAAARDAQMQGDRVMAEYYFQFADHYFRVLSESRPRMDEQQQQRRDRYDFAEDGDEGEMDGGNENDRGDDRDRQPRNERRDADQGYANGNSRQRDEGYEEQRPRPRREPRMPVAEEATPAVARDAEPEDEVREERRPRRGRRPAVEAAPEGADDFDRLPASILPPSFSAPESDAPEPEAEEKPRRRGRKPRSETATVEA